MHIFFYILLYFYFFKSFSFFQLNPENNFESNFGGNLEYLFYILGLSAKKRSMFEGRKRPKRRIPERVRKKNKVVQNYFLEKFCEI